MNAPSNVFPLVAQVVAPMMPSKRPRPIIRGVRVGSNALDWEPEAKPLYTIIDGQTVRAGESFAVTRPGWERWPLGIASDHYKVTSHNTTKRTILEGSSDLVTLRGALQAGHGYHVAHQYEVRHMQASSVEGVPLMCKLIVAHDHTGKGALRAAMVVYLGNEAMGAVVRARALHVAFQPSLWAGEIEAMIEKSILVQDSLIDLLTAASKHKLTDDDRTLISRRKMVIKDVEQAPTLLDAMRRWHQGPTVSSKMTWGVWERRLDDEAIITMALILGRIQYGRPLDLILTPATTGRHHGTRYGGPLTEAEVRAH